MPKPGSSKKIQNLIEYFVQKKLFDSDTRTGRITSGSSDATGNILQVSRGPLDHCPLYITRFLAGTYNKRVLRTCSFYIDVFEKSRVFDIYVNVNTRIGNLL